MDEGLNYMNILSAENNIVRTLLFEMTVYKYCTFSEIVQNKIFCDISQKDQSNTRTGIINTFCFGLFLLIVMLTVSGLFSNIFLFLSNKIVVCVNI